MTSGSGSHTAVRLADGQRNRFWKVLRRRPVQAGLILFGLSLIVHAAIAATIPAPSVLEDEYVVMGTSKMLAGLGPEPLLNKYYPGLSYVSAPIYLLTSDPIVAFRFIQGINTALISLIAPLSFVLIRQLAPTTSIKSATLVGLIAMVYPAYLITHTIAWSEALTATAILAIAVLGMRIWSQPTPAGLFAFGASSGLVTLAHQRAVVLPIALALLVAIWGMRGGLSAGSVAWTLSGVLTGSIVVVGAVVWAGVPLLRPAIVSSISSPELSTSDQIIGLLSHLVGHSFYMIAASGGLVAIAFVATTKDGWAKTSRAPDSAQFVSLLTVLSSVLLLVLSAGFLRNGTSRGDMIIYGRYTEVLLIPLIIVGIAVLWDGSVRRWRHRKLLMVTAGPIAATGVLTIMLHGVVLDVLSNYINTVSLALAYPPMGYLNLPVAIGAGLVLASVTSLWLPVPNRRVVASIAIASIWLLGFSVAYQPQRALATEAALYQTIPDQILLLGQTSDTAVECVGYVGTIDPWLFYLYSIYLSPLALEPAETDACSTLIITVDTSYRPPNGELVLVDDSMPDAFHKVLWFVPSKLTG